ncbi:Variant-specific surface protein, partial [Giardia duodenalis]
VGGCYSVGAVGSGVCREARDRACVRHAEEVTDRKEGPTRVRDTQTGCTAGSTDTDHCANSKCDVTIGDKTYCSQCEANYVPIDGTCVLASGQDTKCTINSKGACTQCGAGYFLHKGGCYQFGGEVGKLICTDPSTSAGSPAAGACTACAPGYFKNPTDVAAGTPPYIACNDTTGFADSTNTYKSVQNCEVCSSPTTPAGARTESVAVCTKCGNSKYLKTDGTCADSCTVNTEFAKVDLVNGNKCVPCGDKSDGIADCKTCSKDLGALKCSACNNDKKPNTAGTACVACTIADCASCDKENVCAACTDKKLSPLGDACLDGCPAGTYADSNVCKPCHTSCASCESNANQDSCTACYPGHVLNRATDSGSTGACIPECTGRYAENCEANQCTAVLGGSKYCSKCKSGFVPVDGLCVSSGTTRAPPAGCTPGTDGTCSACTGTYFKESGGCYLSTAYPGNTLCSQAANGQCSQCANGQTQSNGVCPTCDPTCATCETGKPQECKTCFSGYYFDATNKACRKCSENSADITGVPNCVSCAAPTNNQGSVTCYVTQEPSVNPTDPSVNKSGLSSGAIAGISVAVIVVVGGLVGFLCWWFVYRGKA